MTKPAKVEETKAQKFIRLAEARTNKALAAIAALGGLANKSLYDYNPAQLTAIFEAINKEVAKAAGRFQNPSAKAEAGFTLSDSNPETPTVAPQG